MKQNLKSKIKENITNAIKLGVIPADEAQLNLDVIYDSVLDKVCSVVPMDSVRQVVSCFTLKYGDDKKAVNNELNDVVNTVLMNTAGAMPLDDYGYPTKKVKFEIPVNSTANFYAKYKNITPGTVSLNFYDSDNQLVLKIVDQPSNDNPITIGYLGGDTDNIINYETGLFDLQDIKEDLTSVTKFIIEYDIETYVTDPHNSHHAYFQKSTIEMLADLYELDFDSALVLNDFKGLELQTKIEALSPQVLRQQIDSNVLCRYFERLDLNDTHKVTWDATVDWASNSYPLAYQRLKNLGALLSVEMGLFSRRTGVVPNVILCDALAYGILKNNHGFTSIFDKEVDYSGMPKVVGYFGDAVVILVDYVSPSNLMEGRIVITYKGTNEAQSAAVFAPFIPVTLRGKVAGMESGGMMYTNNVYSISGFEFINPDLVSGIIVNNYNNN